MVYCIQFISRSMRAITNMLAILDEMVHADDLSDNTKAKLYHLVSELRIDVDTLLKIIGDLDDDAEKKMFLECIEAIGIMLEEMDGDLVKMQTTLKVEESH